MSARDTYFRVNGNSVIALDNDIVTTDFVQVQGKNGFSIEVINPVGVNNTPTWTLKCTSSNDVSQLKEYDVLKFKNKTIDSAVFTSDFVRFNDFAIEINSQGETGTIEIIIR